MTELARLQAKADEKRDRLGRTLRTLEERATLLGLADDMHRPRRRRRRTPMTFVEALRRNPFLAAGLAICAGLLVLEVNQSRQTDRRIGAAGIAPRAAALLTSALSYKGALSWPLKTRIERNHTERKPVSGNRATARQTSARQDRNSRPHPAGREAARRPTIVGPAPLCTRSPPLSTRPRPDACRRCSDLGRNRARRGAALTRNIHLPSPPTLRRFTEASPVILGAVGLGIGVLIGALLPRDAFHAGMQGWD